MDRMSILHAAVPVTVQVAEMSNRDGLSSYRLR